MISEKEVPNILENELPEITSEIKESKRNIFRVLNSFTNYTKKCAEIGNIDKLKLCFSIADKFLKEGNNVVKSAVENVYVFSVSSLFDIVSHRQEQVKNILPESLKIAYLKHVTELYALADWKDENFTNDNIDY